jgi:ubiquinone/menaquinone biosynthesis C-methylase UbiE
VAVSVPTPKSAETERVREIWDKTAPRFDKQMAFWERVLFADGRRWACSQAKGVVLEIAVGTGRNFEFYPSDITLTGIDFSAEMLALARRRSAETGFGVDLRQGDAQALDLPDEAFDTVVCTLSLCSIPDDAAAVREIERVLRPGGHLILLEHVASPNRVIRGVQRALELITIRLEGDHLAREPLRHLRRGGLEVISIKRFKWGIVERVVARKPL